MLKAYRLLSLLSFPFLFLWLMLRAQKGKEDSTRLQERWGQGKLPRPEGALVWLHAASVGESHSVLPLVERLLLLYPKIHILITSGTVTSAHLLLGKLPERCIHQYVPVDHPFAVRNFLHHWKPNLALWVESELWPNLLTETRARGCQMVLINARMSERSYKRWQLMPGFIGRLLSYFSMVLPQSKRDSERLSALGAKSMKMLGNLKYDVPPLSANQQLVMAQKTTMGMRPLWVAASTHPGEEVVIGYVHQSLRQTFTDLLTIIVPRHAQRGNEIARDLRQQGLVVAQRSANDEVTPFTDVYLADTMGELGLFYRLADIIFIGGSMIPHGGQNPLEPARLGCAIITGPHMHNFQDVHNEMLTAHACRLVIDTQSLAQAVSELLTNADMRHRLIMASEKYVESKKGVLDAVVNALYPFLEPMR